MLPAWVARAAAVYAVPLASSATGPSEPATRWPPGVVVAVRGASPAAEPGSDPVSARLSTLAPLALSARGPAATQGGHHVTRSGAGEQGG